MISSLQNNKISESLKIVLNKSCQLTCKIPLLIELFDWVQDAFWTAHELCEIFKPENLIPNQQGVWLWNDNSEKLT